MADSRLVVRAHRPRKVIIAWVSSLALAVAGGYALYGFGVYRGGYQRHAAETERLAYEGRAAELERRNSELREQIALLATSRQVDKEAYTQVEGTLAELQGEIQTQREELEFYRGIVAPTDGSRGLRIQDFQLTPGNGNGVYRLRLVLVQAARQDRRVSGVVSLSIDGQRNGAAVSYAIGDVLVAGDAAANMNFSFRYFQDFEKEIVLPDGFEPIRVTVEVNPKGRTAKVIKQSFDWAVQSS